MPPLRQVLSSLSFPHWYSTRGALLNIYQGQGKVLAVLHIQLHRSLLNPPRVGIVILIFQRRNLRLREDAGGEGIPQTTEGAFKSWLTRQTEGRGPLPPRPESRMLPAQLGAAMSFPSTWPLCPLAPPPAWRATPGHGAEDASQGNPPS